MNFNNDNRIVMQEYGTVFIWLEDAYPGFYEMKELVLEFIHIFKNDNDNEINNDSDSDSDIFNKILNVILNDSESESDSDSDQYKY